MRDLRTRIGAPGSVKFVGTVGGLQFGGTVTNGLPDRMSDIVEPSGCRYADYLGYRTIQAQHDPDKPVARCVELTARSDRIDIVGEFPEPGVSAVADEYRALVKSGIINAFSIGFRPLRWEPIKNGGLRFLEWDLIEVSLVSSPANPNALITQRSMRRDGRPIRRDDRPVYVGNCGRPGDRECGLKDPAECSIHGMGEVGFDATGDAERAVRVRYARALQLRLAEPIRRKGNDSETERMLHVVVCVRSTASSAWIRVSLLRRRNFACGVGDVRRQC
jgi:uncharacterized protein